MVSHHAEHLEITWIKKNTRIHWELIILWKIPDFCTLSLSCWPRQYQSLIPIFWNWNETLTEFNGKFHIMFDDEISQHICSSSAHFPHLPTLCCCCTIKAGGLLHLYSESSSCSSLLIGKTWSLLFFCSSVSSWSWFSSLISSKNCHGLQSNWLPCLLALPS